MFNKKEYDKEYNKKYKQENKKYNKKRYYQCITHRKCPTHPTISAALGKVYCSKCLKYQKLRRNNAISQGKCKSHPTRDAVFGKRRCKECLWSGVLYNVSLTDKQATKILEKQNYKCALSGIQLIKGINASPDHIIPIGVKNRYNKNHVLNNIKNIQFVDTQVQYSKYKYSKNEFIKMCRKVVDYQNNKNKK